MQVELVLFELWIFDVPFDFFNFSNLYLLHGWLLIWVYCDGIASFLLVDCVFLDSAEFAVFCNGVIVDWVDVDTLIVLPHPIAVQIGLWFLVSCLHTDILVSFVEFKGVELFEAGLDFFLEQRGSLLARSIVFVHDLAGLVFFLKEIRVFLSFPNCENHHNDLNENAINRNRVQVLPCYCVKNYINPIKYHWQSDKHNAYPAYQVEDNKTLGIW